MEHDGTDLQHVVRRLKRAQGQIGGIIAMIESGRSAQEVVTQVAAVSKAIDRAGFAVIAPVAWLLAPLGARLAHSMDRRRLSVAFGLFLSLVAARMLYRALG